jgi:ATP-dependent Lon protease
MNTSAPVPEFSELDILKQKIESAELPPELKDKTLGMINRASLSFKYGGFITGFEQVANYIDWIVSLPWDSKSEDDLDLSHASEILEKHHYGLHEIKDRILEYLAVMKLNIEQANKSSDIAKHHFSRAPILFFVGLVGTGKTTIAKSIAEAMNRSFVRIPFGGMGSSLDLRGESRIHPDAEVGLIIKALRRSGTRNPVILLDELDRVSEQARADIMGVLVELLDPEQNIAFLDHYIDFPFDLSDVLFIATANNTSHISTAVLDRLEPIQMPSYSDEEKTVIAKAYVFPNILSESGLNSAQLQIEDDVWQIIVRPLGFDSGIRTLERNINEICRKVARMIVEEKVSSVHLTGSNIKQFLPTW